MKYGVESSLNNLIIHLHACEQNYCKNAEIFLNLTFFYFDEHVNLYNIHITAIFKCL